MYENISLELAMWEDAHKKDLRLEVGDYPDDRGKVEIAIEGSDYSIGELDYRFADRFVEAFNRDNEAQTKTKKDKVQDLKEEKKWSKRRANTINSWRRRREALKETTKLDEKICQLQKDL